MRLKLHNLRVRVLLGAAFVTAALAFCYLSVDRNAEGRTFNNLDDLPARNYGLLLGTSIYTPFGGANRSFINRVNAAADLYHAGKIRHIIASGAEYLTDDDGRPIKYGCDELRAMHDSLLTRGIPDSVITLDYEGLRTYRSIAKLRVYGVDSVIVVSQKFHNDRAIRIADHFGVDAIGYNADPTPDTWLRVRNFLREVGARVKLYIDLLTRNDPKFIETERLHD